MTYGEAAKLLAIIMVCVTLIVVALLGIIQLAQGYILGPCETWTSSTYTGWQNWDGKRVRCVLGNPVAFRGEHH